MTWKCLCGGDGETYPQRTFNLVILDYLGSAVSFEHHLAVKEAQERRREGETHREKKRVREEESTEVQSR